MEESAIINNLIPSLNLAGHKAVILPISFLAKLNDELLKIKNILQYVFNRNDPPYINFKIPEYAKSIIVTASPQQTIKVKFAYKGKSILTYVPPTYSYHTDTITENIITNIISPLGYKTSDAPLPLKLLAVTSGLAEYGKNNIAYIKKMGSFFRLKGFFSDLPYSIEPEISFKVMGRCERCNICRKVCPTGAITDERFLVHAERCITFFSEDSREFPDWLYKEWHNCLIGCMICQNNCPVNRPFFKESACEIEFSEKETETILNETDANNLNEEIKMKFINLNLLKDYYLIPRNLKVLLNTNL